MSLFAKIVGQIKDRRVNGHHVKDDRRTSVAQRLNIASNRVDAAIDDLCRTVTMSRDEFEEMMKRELKK